MQPWNMLSALETWLWIIIWWLIAWLFFFLATWIVESKTRAKNKLWALALVAFLAVLLIPILQGVTSVLDGGTGLLNGLSHYIAYFLVILLLVGLAVEYWKTAVIAGFIGILFILIVYNLLYFLGVPGSASWPLFVT
ncbi:MAG: hypothetical protein ACTSRS_21200 [Candidatus Helarchaeota archaeon]